MHRDRTCGHHEGQRNQESGHPKDISSHMEPFDCRHRQKHLDRGYDNGRQHNQPKRHPPQRRQLFRALAPTLLDILKTPRLGPCHLFGEKTHASILPSSSPLFRPRRRFPPSIDYVSFESLFQNCAKYRASFSYNRRMSSIFCPSYSSTMISSASPSPRTPSIRAINGWAALIFPRVRS